MAALAMTALLSSCDIAPSKEKSGSSSGKLKMGVDDSYSLLMDAQIFLYTSLNKNSVIEPTYLPEAEVMDLLIKDSIQAAVVSRPLNEQEMAYFKSIQRSPESKVIAIDGLALIVHPEHTDTTITMDQLRNILDGKDSLWSQINATNKNKLQIVFDNYKSCNARFLREKFELEQFPSYCFALNNNDEVINYVSQNKNAIGVISVSWLNGEEEPVSKKYRSMVKTMGIIDPSNAVDPNMPRTPHQAYIFDRTYPLRRDVYYIRTGLRSTLGTGFGYYLEHDKGQLLIQKMGMIAAQTPQRLVKLTD
jgi:phosphate transport system substrate-binding protein